jgi:hypothetical protein
MPDWGAHQIAGQTLEGSPVAPGIQRRADVDVEPAVAPGVEQAQALFGQQAFLVQHAQDLAAEDLGQDRQVPVAER